MQIQLSGLIQAATGPYGGRANRLKLSTRQDGRILVTPRKTSMTGDVIHPLHAWTRSMWIVADAFWTTLPRRVRALWGMCARRTTDKASSNLDEFRHVNIPRLIVGMPMLRLPPDRFHSYCCYLERPPQYSTHNKKPSMQLWLRGHQKPEPPWTPTKDEPAPPWPPGHPPEPVEFSPLKSPYPHPFVPSPYCVTYDCPDNALYCYDELFLHPIVDFDTRHGMAFLHWKADTSEDRTYREPVWKSQTEIWSERVWYDHRPYEKIMASHVECHTATWLEHELPWPSAYCVQLTDWSSPAVKLSHAFYWRSTEDRCPYHFFELAWVDHVHQTYPWPDSIYLEASGNIIAEPPPCDDPYLWINPHHDPSCMWTSNDNFAQWAGFQWTTTSAVRSDPWLEYCGGTAFASVGPIRCSDSGPRQGLWWFQIVILHAGDPVLLEYRKPSLSGDQGLFGYYGLYDPNDLFPWASPAVLVYDQFNDWPQVCMTDREVAFWWILKLIALEIGMYAITHGASRLLTKWKLMSPYTYKPWVDAATHGKPVQHAIGHGAWRCKLVAKIGERAVRDHEIARQAIKLARAARRVPAIGP